MFLQVFSLSLRICAGGKSEDSVRGFLCVRGLKMASSLSVSDRLEAGAMLHLLL